MIPNASPFVFEFDKDDDMKMAPTPPTSTSTTPTTVLETEARTARELSKSLLTLQKQLLHILWAYGHYDYCNYYKNECYY